MSRPFDVVLLQNAPSYWSSSYARVSFDSEYPNALFNHMSLTDFADLIKRINAAAVVPEWMTRLYWLNLIIFISGLCLMAMGIYEYASTQEELDDASQLTFAAMFAGIGVIVILVAVVTFAYARRLARHSAQNAIRSFVIAENERRRSTPVSLRIAESKGVPTQTICECAPQQRNVLISVVPSGDGVYGDSADDLGALADGIEYDFEPPLPRLMPLAQPKSQALTYKPSLSLASVNGNSMSRPLINKHHNTDIL